MKKCIKSNARFSLMSCFYLKCEALPLDVLVFIRANFTHSKVSNFWYCIFSIRISFFLISLNHLFIYLERKVSCPKCRYRRVLKPLLAIWASRSQERRSPQLISLKQIWVIMPCLYYRFSNCEFYTEYCELLNRF